jgi:threonine dehydratase
LNSEYKSIPLKNDIIQAAIHIKDYIHQTPVLKSELLNVQFSCKLFLKCENFQRKLVHLNHEELQMHYYRLTKAKSKMGVSDHNP